MDARTFFTHWCDFIDADILTCWDIPKEWTRRTIGAAKSAKEESPFAERLLRVAGGNLSRYWKEERGFDLVLAMSDNFSTTAPDADRKDFYPVTHDVVIEQEAAAGSSWVEMVKLVRTRARLKVLITYTWDVPREKKERQESDALVNETRARFQRTIREAAQDWGEDPRTRYLLIIGQKVEQNVGWYFQEFNTMGEFLPGEEWIKNAQ